MASVAYGACIYLRSVNSEGRYLVRLLCAKSRIAPIKKISFQDRIMRNHPAN